MHGRSVRIFCVMDFFPNSRKGELMKHPHRQREGFTLVELLVVIAIIGILVGLLLPAVQAAREAARRMSCSNNFKQIGLAIHNYHSAFKQLPVNMTGTDRSWVGDITYNSSRRRLSYLVSLLPFIEQQGLWDAISNASVDLAPGINTMPTEVRNGRWPPMGPAPWRQQYRPWATRVPSFRCPSDPGFGVQLGRTNYAACYGDTFNYAWNGGRNERGFINNGNDVANDFDETWMVTRASAAQRGFFHARTDMRFRDVLDGLSNTVACGEINTSLGQRETNADYVRSHTALLLSGAGEHIGVPAECAQGAHIDPERPRFFSTTATVNGGINNGRGARWADGQIAYAGVQTILPPNSPSCVRNNADGNHGFWSMSSRHKGGAHVLMGDGAVIFITDSIESGDQTEPTVCRDGPSGFTNIAGVPSPYGLWGALGSRAQGETIDMALNQ